VELSGGSLAQPVEVCGSAGTNFVARHDRQLGAGTYFVVVRDDNNAEVGPYNLVLQIF